ncbi:CDC42 small effector protein 2 [Exaiptasia diaphana]|uniref:CRIB domain-containing protein n=1 Tax=Exaiptasia diaphana TaxID=2652724 RepID=A0A913X5L0_EXADI|nr:CDC42 small effector protein 2 [Exaiptasia diaphana]
MSELLVCFPCCLTSRPQPRPARPRIDRSMIGLPTNFRHTGHIGSGDMASGTDLNQVQSQMQSKGGYNYQQQNVAGTPDGILVGSP